MTYQYHITFPLVSDQPAEAITAQQLWTALRLRLHSIVPDEAIVGVATLIASIAYFTLDRSLLDGPDTLQ